MLKVPTLSKGHSDSVDQLCWDPTSGDRLATASADRSVRIWDIRSGSKVGAVRVESR
jgi:THO complex subunit 3